MPPVDPVEQAFLAAIDAHRGMLIRLVSLYARSAEEQADFFQEILFQAWKSWSHFRGESARSTWLYRIALNTLLTAHRQPNRLDYPEHWEPIQARATADPHQQEAAQRLYRAMRQLRETDRAIVSLHLDGYSNPEIADIIGIASNHVGVKLHRIKQHLKNLLNEGL